jgi:2-dehydro-3-deoxygluconokinase
MNKPCVFFGELLLRLGAPGHGLLTQSPRLDVHYGGAEANVATGLAHLGHSCRMASFVPANALGRSAKATLRGRGVDCSAVVERPGRMGLYFLETGAGPRASAIIYDRERSAFAMAGPADIDWPKLLDGARLLHLSGITCALGAESSAMVLEGARVARSLGVTVSFDVNYRASLWERWGGDSATIIGTMMDASDVLFANHVDLSLVSGQKFNPNDDPDDRAAAMAFERWPNLKLIASTIRNIASAEHHRLAGQVYARDAAHRTDALELTGIVDRIGAGDAFATGVLHGFLKQNSLKVMAETGVALAALKHTLPGDASLFSQADIDAFVAGTRDVRR